MRQYTPIWNQIKTEFHCEISAHKAYHRRIIKAVVKEKDLDLGFKFELSERSPPQTSLLKSSRSGSIIKFTLTLKPLTTRHITIDSI